MDNYHLSRYIVILSRDKNECKKWIACPLWATTYIYVIVTGNGLFSSPQK